MWGTLSMNILPPATDEGYAPYESQQIEAIPAVTKEITKELDLTTLLGLITRRAVELVKAASGGIYLWNEAGQVLIPQPWYGHGIWMRGIRFKLGEGITRIVAQRREGMIVNDRQELPYAQPTCVEHNGTASRLAGRWLYRRDSTEAFLYQC
jgi:putative methionine-R-sulfoxide reductase with GAF domain